MLRNKPGAFEETTLSFDQLEMQVKSTKTGVT